MSAYGYGRSKVIHTVLYTDKWLQRIQQLTLLKFEIGQKIDTSLMSNRWSLTLTPLLKNGSRAPAFYFFFTWVDSTQSGMPGLPVLIQTNECREYRTSKPNIPVVGLSSCGHSAISLLSASVLISTQLPPINTQQAMYFYIKCIATLACSSLSRLSRLTMTLCC